MSNYGISPAPVCNFALIVWSSTADISNELQIAANEFANANDIEIPLYLHDEVDWEVEWTEGIHLMTKPDYTLVGTELINAYHTFVVHEEKEPVPDDFSVTKRVSRVSARAFAPVVKATLSKMLKSVSEIKENNKREWKEVDILNLPAPPMFIRRSVAISSVEVHRRGAIPDAIKSQGLPIMHFLSVNPDGKIINCASKDMGHGVSPATMWHGVLALHGTARLCWYDKSFESRAKQAVYSFLFRYSRPADSHHAADHQNVGLFRRLNAYIHNGSASLQRGKPAPIITFSEFQHPVWVPYVQGHKILALKNARGKFPTAKLGGGFVKALFAECRLPLPMLDAWLIFLYLMISVRHENQLVYANNTPEWHVSSYVVRRYLKKRPDAIEFIRSQGSRSLLLNIVPDFEVVPSLAEVLHLATADLVNWPELRWLNSAESDVLRTWKLCDVDNH
jgi:hypothetical protein